MNSNGNNINKKSIQNKGDLCTKKCSPLYLALGGPQDKEQNGQQTSSPGGQILWSGPVLLDCFSGKKECSPFRKWERVPFPHLLAMM